MALTKYTFVKLIDPSKLLKEIQESAILIAVDRIDTHGDVVEIWMKSALSPIDESHLSNIVQDHVPVRDEPETLYDISNKNYVHETSRPMGMTTCFTSEGDDVNDMDKVGGGQTIRILHEVGDALEQSIYIDFNVKKNRSFAHEGYIVWKGADFDELSLSTVPTLTPYTAGTNTNFMNYNGLVVPAAGNGNIQINLANAKLVEMPLYEMGNGKRPTAFWNATFNTNTNTFSNITPAPLGDGVYNMFVSEIEFHSFARRILLIDSGFLMLQTADSSEIGHGMRMKFSIKTSGADHQWKASCILTLHRTRTC